MKIISWNVNGVRSVIRKGFFEWLKEESPDILCLQEIKIGEDKLTFDLLYPTGYYSYFNTAKKPGYAGVAVFTKHKPRLVNKLLGMDRFDSEGRLLEMHFKDFSLLNLYTPNGGRDKHDMDYKFKVYKRLFDYSQVKSGKKTILVGDFNIAHTEADLARPKENVNNTMFTFPERMQIDKLLALGYVDTYRELEKGREQYSWWSYMRGVREKNIGWRIDYCFVSKDIKKKVGEAFILDKVKGSDHCPVGIELKV